MRLNKIIVPAGAAESKVPVIKCEHNVTDDGVELQFHDVIGSWWDESTSRSVGNILKANRGKPVHVSINSGGGYVFEGIGIFNMLLEHDGPVTTTIEGNAASIATIISLAGDVRRIRDNGSMMIHRAWGATVGNAGQLRNEAAILDKVDQQIATTYAARAGGTAAGWLDRMAGPKDSDGTWYTAEEAKAAGLVDEVIATEGKPDSKDKKKKKNHNDGFETTMWPWSKELLAKVIEARLRVVALDSEV